MQDHLLLQDISQNIFDKKILNQDLNQNLKKNLNQLYLLHLNQQKNKLRNLYCIKILLIKLHMMKRI